MIPIPMEVIALDAKVYEVLALAMRYFFALIGVMIVWRSFSWLRKDRRQKHRRLKQLPDAGTIGILTVESGSRELRPGEIIPMPHEGVLGYLRTCDVVVPVDDVATMHLDFTFADGKGLYILPRRGCEAWVDGVLLLNRRDSMRHPMLHGSVLQVGQAVLRLGIFAGLNVPEVRPAYASMEYDPMADFPQTPEQPMSWPQPEDPPPYAPMNPPGPPVWQPAEDEWQGYAPPEPPARNPWQGGDADA